MSEMEHMLRETEEERRPMLLPWKITSADTVTLATDIHLYYPSALQPDEWPRESAGKFVRVSELFRYVIRREYLEDESKTSIEFTSFVRALTFPASSATFPIPSEARST